jgi:predicted alpha/beta superfamily hydrolase
MKKSIFILIMVIPAFVSAESGRVFDDLSMNSEILNMERKYALYLPPDYETSQRRYPVLYLLHGGGGRPIGMDSTWGELNPCR